MKELLSLLVVAASFSPALSSAQSKPLFPGAELLDTCVVELPLTYAKKGREYLREVTGL